MLRIARGGAAALAPLEGADTFQNAAMQGDDLGRLMYHFSVRALLKIRARALNFFEKNCGQDHASEGGACRHDRKSFNTGRADGQCTTSVAFCEGLVG